MTQKLIPCRTCWDHAILIVPRRWGWEVWLTLKTSTMILQQVRILESYFAQKPQWWISASNGIKCSGVENTELHFSNQGNCDLEELRSPASLAACFAHFVLHYSAQTCPTEAGAFLFYLGSTIWSIASCKHSFRCVNIDFSCNHY